MGVVVSQRFESSRLRYWSALPLRAIVGYGFIAHGMAKIMSGPDHFAATLHALGVPAPSVMAWLTIGWELLGGFAVLVGAYIPVVSGPLSVILLTAAISYTCGTASVRSSCKPSRPAAAIRSAGSGNRSADTSPRWRRSCSVAAAHWPSERGARIGTQLQGRRDHEHACVPSVRGPPRGR